MFASHIFGKEGGTYANYASGTQSYLSLNAYDSTDKITGIIDCYTETDGLTNTRIVAFDPNDYTKYSVISASVDSNGNSSTYAPTPAFNANDNNIATTAWVKNLFATLFPVGGIYITAQNTGSCPIADLIPGSQWQLVAQDRALWGGDGTNANTTIAAGLPNITGNFGSGCLMIDWQGSTTGGALYRGESGGGQNSGGTDGSTNASINFDASRSNSIYGASSTVQPPAYRVNVWVRTA